ncbi:MAG: M20 family metallopeptidase [Planctomycetales bacterium]
MALDPVDTLSQLVAIPSVNPMGRGLTGPEFLETRVTQRLEEMFDALGVPWTRQSVEPDRDNIIARLDGAVSPEQGGQVILWEAHQDTVPVDGMTIDPWDPIVRDGKLQGRGSCDVKGGMTAMLAAFSRLVEERPPGMPTLLIACTINEEYGYSGARRLTEMWAGENDSFFPRAPDAVIVAEPTNLNVVVAHKGTLRWKCRVRGRAAHSSQPHLGDNAIYKMARVLIALEAYHREIVPTISKHPLCGSPSLSVGTISGGLSVNTVPDECVIDIDRRLLPGEHGEAVFRQVQEFVAGYQDVPQEIEHDEPWMWGDSLSADHNETVAGRLRDASVETGGRCELVGVPYGTNASQFARAGIPSVVFGPGSIDQAHTADEWLSLDELHRAVEILHRFGSQGL